MIVDILFSVLYATRNDYTSPGPSSKSKNEKVGIVKISPSLTLGRLLLQPFIIARQQKKGTRSIFVCASLGKSSFGREKKVMRGDYLQVNDIQKSIHVLTREIGVACAKPLLWWWQRAVIDSKWKNVLRRREMPKIGGVRDQTARMREVKRLTLLAPRFSCFLLLQRVRDGRVFGDVEPSTALSGSGCILMTK